MCKNKNWRTAPVRKETRELFRDVYGVEHLAVRIAILRVRNGDRYPIRFDPEEVCDGI